jgi:3-oxoadipate enol-lactonase
MSDGGILLPVYETEQIELADGTHRTVLDVGEGSPVLLINGLAGAHGHWGRPFLDELLAGGRRVLSVNHLGIAGSSRPKGHFSIADLAAAQAESLDVLGVTGPVDVFGISMGGMTAQELALNHPGHVRSLVLGCTTPGGAHATWTAQSDMEKLVGALQSRDAAKAMRASWEINVSAGFAAEHDDRFEEYVEASVQNRVSLRVLSEQVQALHGHDAVDRLAAIGVPTTIAHGTEDLLLPYPNAARLLASIPGATLETFDGAGHLFFWEDPQRAAQVALETSARAA